MSEPYFMIESLMMMKRGADMDKRICEACGSLFLPRRKDQKCCGQIKLATCPICGKKFERKCAVPVKMTCSRKCSIEYTKIRQKESSENSVRKCKFCGKEFHPKSSRSMYCEGPHFGQCEVCGKEFEIKDVQSYVPRTCSDDCRWILSKQNVDNDNMVENLRTTMREKYGVNNAMEVDAFRSKIIATNRAKYGVDHFAQTDMYHQKILQSSIVNYGVRHHLQAEVVRQKIGDTVKQRYGVKNVFQSQKVKDKIKETNLAKYGTEYYSSSDDWLIKNMIDSSKISSYLSFRENPHNWLESHSGLTYLELEKELGVSRHHISSIVNELQLHEYILHSYSNMENEIISFICSINKDIHVVQNTRSVIGPYELDIYIPELKLGIECNPTATHNSSICDPWGGGPKSPSYHQMKTNICEEKGIQLFHIFGYEWEHRRPVIESMLRNLLKCNEDNIYARKCAVRKVKANEAFAFLRKNHRQGGVHSKIRLGLYYNEELVSLMTFGKMRSTIGTGSADVSDCYELVRFCSKLNTSVVGGASKLFKYFVRNYNPRRIRSFSDRAHTKGNLYRNLGFQEVARSDAGYTWVDLSTDISYNRVNAQKHNLQKFLKDENIDLDRSERQIMIEHGFVQVYDCGTITWEWKI